VWIEHGRYINFISDFSAANPKASREDALKAWKDQEATGGPHFLLGGESSAELRPATTQK
jgi:hypothetical protein